MNHPADNLADNQANHPANNPAEPIIASRTGIERPSPIWLAPLIAAAIGLWLIWQHYADQGPLITIAFQSAEGLEAGRTPIKYLDVEMGRVEKVEIDRVSGRRVVVTARMVREAVDYLNGRAGFWVVRPRVGLGGITGLQTLLSGSHIEMSGVLEGGKAKRTFEGLEQPPLTPVGAPGLRIGLRAAEAGAVEPGSPVFHRGMKVGTVEGRRLSEGGEYVEFGAFVHAPYHRLIDTNTRFWNAGGIDFTVGTEGLALRSESLEALIFGGIAFTNPPRLQAGVPVESGALFTLYDTRAEAEMQPTEGAVERLGYVLHFKESLRGLKVGAPVEHRGVRIGYVADIDIRYDPITGLFETPVLIFLDPQRIKWPDCTNPEDSLLAAEEGLPTAVAHGLRARLQTGSLLTGALFVELAKVPDAEPGVIVDRTPYPEFPTVSSPFGEISGKAMTLLDTLAALPLEELLSSASRLLKDMDTLVRAPAASEVAGDADVTMAQLRNAPLRRFIESMTATLAGIDAMIGAAPDGQSSGGLAGSLGDLQATLKSVRDLLQGDATASPLYYELSTALRELTQAARALRALTEAIEDKPNALIFGR
uniref:Paraquat-inducible protein B n=1 Tax=Candidatus Kentrum sp. DK TaxID=2126562 RepID=A0A450SU95_9GAMM|nr:MAG: paraquat-inducible protein B [Candidatus Kentron sp. DK]